MWKDIKDTALISALVLTLGYGVFSVGPSLNKHGLAIRTLTMETELLEDNVNELREMSAQLKFSTDLSEQAIKRIVAKTDELDKQLENNYAYQSNELSQLQTIVKSLLTSVEINKNAATSASQALFELLERNLEKLNAKLDALVLKKEELTQHVLNPTVGISYKMHNSVKNSDTVARVGSGTIIKKIQNVDGSYTYFVLSAYHVQDVSDLPGSLSIAYAVDLFDYRGIITYIIVDAALDYKPTKADFDAGYDFCIFSFKYDKELAVANLATNAEVNELTFGDAVIAAGCSAGRDPNFQEGFIQGRTLSGAHEFRHSAHIIYGNSGGPVFLAKCYKLIGVNVSLPITSNYPVSWLGNSVSLSDIRTYLKEHKAFEYLD